MKLLKRTAVLALAIMMLTALLVLPASAVLTSPYYSHVCAFHELYNGSPENAYIRAAQCFLYHYSSATRKAITNAGGIDGGYGNGTENAVRLYQKDKWPNDNSVEHVQNRDGRVGPKTWAKIAGDLYVGYEGGEYAELRYNGGNVIYVDLRAEGYTYYNCNESGVKDRRIVSH